jgi:threonine dehydrogenase-like Zn-dependent dehydrogenase
MEALLFEMKLGKLIKAYLRGKRKTSGYWKKGGPISIKEVPIPKLIAEDWVLVKTIYCGICGSDMKELTLSGARDNPLQSLISFPQTMGHEPVGIIEKIGPKVKKIKSGDRVAISPWLSCKPRGVIPECYRCEQGDFTHCKNFQRGNLPQGMHLGVTSGLGGFAPYIAVHESQCFVIPESVTFDQAVLADPFSVAFHSCLLLDPNPDSIILIYGLGVIGLCTILCLKKIFNVRHILGIGRYEFQKEIAKKVGAEFVFMSNGAKLIEEIANYLNIELFTPEIGYKWAIDGVDGIIDTIASAETLEIGIRILSTQGKLVFSGVNTPQRTENTPHYFKELQIIGSNAFSVEKFNGERKHAFEFYLRFLKDKKIDPSLLITHKFQLDKYQDAFNVLANKRHSRAIKVLFDFTK